MKRLIAGIILGCLSLAPAWAASSSVSMPSFWRYAHPNAKALVGIEWQRLLKSELGQELRDKIETQNADKPEWAANEIIDQINRVFISSPGRAEGATGGQTPAVIAVQGNFDLDRIRELAAPKTGDSFVYGSTEILENVTPSKSGGQPMAVALVSPQLLLLGDVESVQDGIDHYLAADPGQMSNPLFVRAAALSGNNDIWIVANASPADFSQGGMQQAQFLNKVTSIEAGLSLQSGLGLRLNLGTDSKQSAAELAAGIQMMAGMFLSSAAQKPGMPNLAEKIQVSTDASRVTLALALDKKELAESFGKMTSADAPDVAAASPDADANVPLRAKVAGSGHWKWGQVQRPEPKPEKQVITIWGLEEGKKEIPIQQ